MNATDVGALQRRRDALLAAGARASAPLARSEPATPPNGNSYASKPPRLPGGARSSAGLVQWALECSSAPRSEPRVRAGSLSVTAEVSAPPQGRTAHAATTEAHGHDSELQREAAERWARGSGVDLLAAASPYRSPASARQSALETARDAAVAWTTLSGVPSSDPAAAAAAEPGRSSPSSGRGDVDGAEKAGARHLAYSPPPSAACASPAAGRGAPFAPGLLPPAGSAAPRSRPLDDGGSAGGAAGTAINNNDDLASVASSAPREALLRAGEWRWTNSSTNTSPGGGSTPTGLAAAVAWAAAGARGRGSARCSSGALGIDESVSPHSGGRQSEGGGSARSEGGKDWSTFEQRRRGSRAASEGFGSARSAGGGVGGQPAELHRALFRAAKGGDTARVAALLASMHERALAHAARGSSVPAREAVSSALDSPWAGAGASHGWTLLHVAAEQGHLPIARLLLERGACARVVHARSGIAPIHFAAREGRANLAQLLLQAGADGAAAEAHGWTALHLAALMGNEAVVSLLLLHSPHALHSRTAKNRESVLHVAAREGHVGCASLLLQADADPAALDSRGRTPLDLAQAHGRAELVQLLRQWLPPGKEVSDAASPAASPGAASTPLPAARPLLLADQQREKGDAGIVLPVPPARHSGAPAAEGTGTPSSAAAAEEQSAPLPSQKPKPPRRSLLGVFLRGAVGALGFVSTLAVVVVLLAVVVVDVECDGNSSVCAPT